MIDLGRVVFVGNCQIGAMAQVYRRYVPQDRAALVTYVESYRVAGEDTGRLIAEADLVVLQVTEFAQAVGAIETRGKMVFVPMAMCPFLWPFGGEAHPSNTSSDALPGGPYPGETGDSFLNRHVRAGTPPADAARLYRDYDVAAAKNVERMAEITLAQQRRRDASCGGYDVAGLIERRLPHEPLFRSRGYLDPPILRHLAETLYAGLNADTEFMNYLATTEYDDLVPRIQLPIHPSIARRFGMRHIDDRTHYEFYFEGAYSFMEWAERYVACEWNQAMQQAMHLARLGDMEQAIPMWEKSLEVSLRSVIGRVNLAEVMARNGMTSHAVRWIREALALEPDNATLRRRAEEIQNDAERIARARKG